MLKKFILIVILISFPQSAFSEHLINADEALREIYKKATSFEESSVQLSEDQIRQIEDTAQVHFSESHLFSVTLYQVFENDLLVGYAFEDTVMGKWGPIHYLAGLDKNGIILKIVILDYDEIRGKPIAKKRFLKQYKGKTVDDPITIRKDIDGVTGATISSRSLTDGIRKIVHILYLIKS